MNILKLQDQQVIFVCTYSLILMLPDLSVERNVKLMLTKYLILSKNLYLAGHQVCP